jgi:hypothetical protein
MRRKFNPEMHTYLKKYGRHHTLKEWQTIINEKFSENFTLKDTQMYFCRHNIPFKYEQPQKANGGVALSLPIGSERVKADGMVQVKVGQRRWEYKQRLIYQQYYSVKLTSDDYIIFLDQDRTNFDISNLKRVSRRESSILSNQKMFSHNPKITELGIDVAKTMIKAKDKEVLYAKGN